MNTSIVNYSYVNKKSNLRFDAEYYHPFYLRYEKIIGNKPNNFISLSGLGLKIDASAFYPSLEPYYSLGDMPFLRVLDINTKIDYDNCITIPHSIFKKYKTLKKGKLGDIVITKGGSIGRIGLLEKESALCRDVIFINSSKLPQRDYVFLFYYCITDIYQNLLVRSSSMTAQPHLTLTLVKDIPIFRPRDDFKELILKIHLLSEKKYNLSRVLFKKSQKYLVSELGIQDWEPRHTLTFVKNYFDAKEADRIDAEYFQPKYDEIYNIIRQYNHGFDSLENLVEIRDDNYQPEENKIYNYIELADIGNNGEIINHTQAVGLDLPSRARRMVKNKDLIVSSIEGSLDKIAIIPQDHDSSLCSTGFFVMHSDKIEIEVLFIFLKTVAGLLQLKRGCSGTILTAISKNELNKIVVPRLDPHLQNNIKQMITKSFSLNTISNSLLEIAKKGVEIAIEEDEVIAEKWIKSEISKAGININT